MKFSGKMCLMITLKVTKKQGFTFCLEDTIFEKPHGGGGGMEQIHPAPPLAVLGLKKHSKARLHIFSLINFRRSGFFLISFKKQPHIL